MSSSDYLHTDTTAQCLVSFEVKKGKLLGFLKSNGAGKAATVRIFKATDGNGVQIDFAIS